MDTLTHALSGALLARAAAPRHADPATLSLRARLLAGAAAAAFPDSDFLLTLIDPLTYLNGHRGITHSILLWPLWSLALALLFSRIGCARHLWRQYAGVCAQGIGIHIAGDVITSYGTRIFAPFSDFEAAWPFTFIIDPYFTALLLTGLLASGYRHSRRPARIALAVLAAYVGMQAWLHHDAVALAERRLAAAPTGATAHALPQPLSPFYWKLLIAGPEGYQETYVDLLARQPPAPAPADAAWWTRLRAQYRPAHDLHWQARARFGTESQRELAGLVWMQPSFAAYRRFAKFPALYRSDVTDRRQCAWFVDLRFTIDALTPPFRYGLCREGGGEWRLNRLPREYFRTEH